MLRYGHDYIDIGEDAYEQRSRTRRFVGLNAAAKALGYERVPVQPTAGG